MDLGIAGRVALVTGGSRGLGREAALSLAREGVNVAVCGRTRATLDTTVEEIRAHGVTSTGVVADASDVDGMDSLHSRVVDELGPIDILVNNAGGSRSRADFPEVDLDDYRATFDLNLFGGFQLAKLAVGHMREPAMGTDHQRHVHLRPRVRRQRLLHVGQGGVDCRDQAHGQVADQGRGAGEQHSARLHLSFAGKLGALSKRKLA